MKSDSDSAGAGIERIPIVGKMHQYLKTGNVAKKLLAAAILYFIIPFGGYVLAFWAGNRLINYLRRKRRNK